MSKRGVFRRKFAQCVILGGVLACLTVKGSGQQTSILNTKHNLSSTGPGPVKALAEDRVCIFCHTPHNAGAAGPLWNRRESAAAYIPYDSPTLRARPGQPTGSSKLCLSCHDGTIAMGDLLSQDAPIDMTHSGVIFAGPSLIGTDLRDDHPISFEYEDAYSQSDGTLTSPGTWHESVQLDAQGMLQCTTCHDPHDDEWGDFLVISNAMSALCRQCHRYDAFEMTSHSISLNTWNGTGDDPWPHSDYGDVRTNACLNCHQSHHAGSGELLLTSAVEEDVCFVCHDGSVASTDLQSVFQLPYRHPVDLTQGVHEAGESPTDAAGHVECADCHNPHQAYDTPAQAPFVQGLLVGVSGLDSTGLPVDEAAYEYEVCFKCHSEEGFTPLNSLIRDVHTTNVMKEFSPNAVSFHPVETQGVNFDVPSLISPLSPSSLIYCTDCHGSSADPDGLSGLSGPHGSQYEFLLSRQYQTRGRVTESAASYALCYECHSRTSILANDSFSEHRLHIVDERTPCSTCHDPHGIPLGEGTAQNNAHLINFDLTPVNPDSVTGRLEYISLGSGTGECYLRCHGVDHSPETYP